MSEPEGEEIVRLRRRREKRDVGVVARGRESFESRLERIRSVASRSPMTRIFRVSSELVRGGGMGVRRDLRDWARGE